MLITSPRFLIFSTTRFTSGSPGVVHVAGFVRGWDRRGPCREDARRIKRDEMGKTRIQQENLLFQGMLGSYNSLPLLYRGGRPKLVATWRFPTGSFTSAHAH